jgi:hypothetical protein
VFILFIHEIGQPQMTAKKENSMNDGNRIANIMEIM